ncbi:MAG: Ig-like domain-containing protein [Candidatus Latescibacteria bacterium]|nr:Ig-like domain-containing protein [Candidatus Latescibacterota bacterium]
MKIRYLFTVLIIMTVVGLTPGNSGGITLDSFSEDMINTYDCVEIQQLDLDIIHFSKKSEKNPETEDNTLFTGDRKIPYISDTIYESKTIWVEVLPETDTISIGDIIQLEAWVRDLKYKSIDSDIHWLISDPSSGSVSENGLFTARKSGEVIITAYSGKIAGSAKITITDHNSISADAQ